MTREEIKSKLDWLADDEQEELWDLAGAQIWTDDDVILFVELCLKEERKQVLAKIGEIVSELSVEDIAQLVNMISIIQKRLENEQSTIKLLNHPLVRNDI